MTKFQLGIYQGAPIPGKIEQTLQQMELIIRAAGERNVQLVVFPELYVTGYLPSMWERFPTVAEEHLWHQRIAQVSKETGCWVVFGHPSYRVQPAHPLDERLQSNPEGTLTNAISLVSPDGVVGTYAKVHLYGREPDVFVYGSEFPVWQTPFGRIALQSCYDIEFPESARLAAVHGAQILINPANNMDPFADYHRRFTMTRAMENSMFAINVNRVGSEEDLNFCGASCVAHPKGQWLLETGGEENLFTLEINLDDLSSLDPSLEYLKKRRPEVYQDLATR